MSKPDLTKLTTEELDARLANIFQRSEEAEAGLARLVAERRALAVHAASGDAKAEASMRAMNELHGALATEIDLCRLAADEVSQHRRMAAEREAAQARAAVVEEARVVAAEMLAESHAVDAALIAMREALERRTARAHKLAALGFRNHRLHHIESVARAAGAAGLRGRLPFVPGSMSHWAPLAEQDKGLVGAMLAQAIEISAQRPA